MRIYELTAHDIHDSVDAIVRDINDRPELRDAWYEMDAHTRNEIKRAWGALIAIRPAPRRNDGQ